MTSRLPSIFRLAALTAVLGVQACAPVGPDYIRPELMLTPSFLTDEPKTAVAPTSVWWAGFGDPELIRVVARADAQNLDLRQAQARLQRSRALAAAAGAALAPTVDAAALRSSVSQSLLSPIGAVARSLPGFQRDYAEQAVGLAAGWEIDLFGGLRRNRQAARAEASAAANDAAALKVAIAADAADAYLQIRSYQARLKVAEAQAKVESELLTLVRQREDQGVSPERDRHEAEAELAGVTAAIPPLMERMDAELNRLDVLMGSQPGAFRAEILQSPPSEVVPALVLAGRPSELFRRRPDVAAAEQRLIASNARIGTAIAEYYPKLSFSSLLGVDSLDADQLFTGSALTHELTGGLRWRLLDFGRIDGEVQAAKGQSAEALAAYRASVLRAAEEVENALDDYVREQTRVEALDREISALTLARRQAQQAYEEGAVSLIEVRDADRDLLAASDQLQQARTAVCRAAVASFRALGGGWGAANAGKTSRGE